MKAIFLTALLALFIPLPAFAEEAAKESAFDRVMRTGTLKCGYYAWPPYFEQDFNTNEITGLAADYARAAGSLLGLKVEFVQLAAIGLQAEELKKGIYDAYCLDSYYVFSSIKAQDFGTPFFFAPVFPYVRHDDDRFKSLDDLNKPEITFVGIDGDISVEMVGRRFPNAKLVSLPSTSDGSQLMMNVATKKADVAIIDPGIVESYNATNPVQLKITSPETPVAVYPISFSVAKGEEDLLNMLNGAVSALQNTGTTESIVKKYNLPKDSVYLPATPYKTN